MQYTVLQATPDDVEPVSTCGRSSCARPARWTTRSPPGSPRRLDASFARLSGRWLHGWVVVTEGRIIATIGLSPYESLLPLRSGPTGRQGYVLNTNTVPGCRRRGVATALVSSLVASAYARSFGVVRLWLVATEDGRPPTRSTDFVTGGA